jgi:hypothetical protein
MTARPTDGDQLDTTIQVLEQLPVGGELASRLYALRGQSLGSDAAVRVATLWAKVSAWAAAEQMVAITDAIDALDPTVTNDFIKAPLVIGQELACATRLAVATAMAQVNLTLQVGDVMPLTWEALDRGDWSLTHVRALARVTQHSSPRVIKEVEACVVPSALRYGWTPSQVAKYATRALIAIDPDGCAERAAAAKAEGDVRFAPLPDEVADLNAFGDAVALRRVFDTLNSRAAQMKTEGDDRRVGLRRLDALVTAVLGDSAGESGRNAVAAQALIAIPADAIVGSDAPGELAGYGPITAATARGLAANAIWRKLILDPTTGETLDLGMHSYRPNDPLIRFIKARDWTCRFPGCSQPATVCDCDHRDDHHAGGPTSRANLQLLCRLHHNLKTCKVWASLVDDDGQPLWVSPFGRTYEVTPNWLLNLIDEPADDPLETEPGHEPAWVQAVVDEPDPPWPDEPPPISADDLEAYLDAADWLERRAFFDANENYDRFRRLGLIA